MVGANVTLPECATLRKHFWEAIVTIKCKYLSCVVKVSNDIISNVKLLCAFVNIKI